MSYRAQENNMRRLAGLLSHDLGYISGAREGGPNGDKKTFLNVGKAFLRTLSKDLSLHDAIVTANPGGIAVSGECCLNGMWENGGIHICIHRPCFMGENVLLYRTIRSLKDHKGGHNNYICCRDLDRMSYAELLECILSLRKAPNDERAA